MASITLKGNPINTTGNVPVIETLAPDFTLTKDDLQDVSLSAYKGKRVILNIFPSIDTDICAASVRKFNAEINKLDNAVVLCISRDLPFAQKRFCAAEGLENVITLSEFRTADFGEAYGVTIVDGPLAGLFSRAVVVIDTDGKVIYTEQVPEIVQEPAYQPVIDVLS